MFSLRSLVFNFNVYPVFLWGNIVMNNVKDQKRIAKRVGWDGFVYKMGRRFKPFAHYAMIFSKIIMETLKQCQSWYCFFLDPQPWPERSYELRSVCPTICPSVWKLFWHRLITFFLKLMVLRAHAVLCVTGLDFLKQYFGPKSGENGPKIGFLISRI